MQISTIQNPNNFICPKFTSLLIIIFHFISMIICYYVAYVVLYFLIYLCFDIIICILVFKGINSKSYNDYLNALKLSLIINIISSFIKGFILFLGFILSIGFTEDYDDDDSYSDEKYFSLFIYFTIIIIYFSVEWLLTFILYFYKNKIKNFCSLNIQTQFLTNSILHTLSPNQNLNYNNNFIQTNAYNNQNLNGPYNNQNLNGPYFQSYAPNLNIQPNVQNLNVPLNEQNYTQNPI